MKIDGAGAVSYTHVVSEMKRRGRLIVRYMKDDDMVCGIFGMGTLGYSECLWTLQDIA